jgi:hypothetical protein
MMTYRINGCLDMGEVPGGRVRIYKRAHVLGQDRCHGNRRMPPVDVQRVCVE